MEKYIKSRKTELDQGSPLFVFNPPNGLPLNVYKNHAIFNKNAYHPISGYQKLRGTVKGAYAGSNKFDLRDIYRWNS